MLWGVHLVEMSGRTQLTHHTLLEKKRIKMEERKFEKRAEENMYKSQKRRRKISGELSTILRIDLKFMEKNYIFHGLFYFVARTINIFY